MKGTREKSKEEQVIGNFFICLQQDFNARSFGQSGTRRKARKNKSLATFSHASSRIK